MGTQLDKLKIKQKMDEAAHFLRLTSGVGVTVGSGVGATVGSSVGSGVSHKYPGGLVLSSQTVSAIQS